MFSHASSSTRQSMETIERINSENIRLHDEVNELHHSLVSSITNRKKTFSLFW
jgi:uncharacterized protein (UPF0335 family)